MNKRTVFAILLTFTSLIILCSCGCSKKRNGPEQSQELEFNSDSVIVSTSGDRLIAVGYDVLSAWSWDKLSEPPQTINFDRSWLMYGETAPPSLVLNEVYVLFSSATIIHPLHTNDDTLVILNDLGSNEERKRFKIGRRWNCELVSSSSNGKFAVLGFREEIDFVFRDENRKDEGRYRIGFIGSSDKEISWISDIYDDESGAGLGISGLAVSEDGKYAVATGVYGGGFIHLADVEKKQVMWQKVPHGSEVPNGPWTVNFNNVCFSPDSKYIYVAGNTGLFCFETATGKILSQHAASDRLGSVAASPDGRLVAAGTLGYSGDVYVYDTNTDTLVLEFETGQKSSYSLAFSSDSRYLATAGITHSNIKIWKMPLVGTEVKPGSNR